MTRAARAKWFALVASLLGAAASIACGGCSKSDEAKPTHNFDLTTRLPPQPASPSAESAGSAPVAPPPPPPRAEITTETEPEQGTGAAAAPAIKPAPAAASASAPKANPDDPILQQARAACGRCFSSLPTSADAPDRSAHVSFTVVSTGTVSRADVSSDDTSEASVLDCIQKTAQSVVFSDNGDGPLRTYAIDVRVHASPSNGGR